MRVDVKRYIMLIALHFSNNNLLTIKLAKQAIIIKAVFHKIQHYKIRKCFNIIVAKQFSLLCTCNLSFMGPRIKMIVKITLEQRL